MRKILVTGGLGFIGSNLVDKLILDNEVVIIDDFSTGQLKNVGRHLKNPRLKLIKGSILEVNKVEEVLKDGIDSIVHLAAVVSVVRSSREPRLVHQVNGRNPERPGIMFEIPGRTSRLRLLRRSLWRQ